MSVEVLINETQRQWTQTALDERISFDAAVIDLEQPPLLSHFTGLNLVLERVESEMPILMLAFTPLATLADDARYHRALTYPNVRYARSPVSVETMATLLTEMHDGTWTRPPDLLTRRVLALPQMQGSVLSTIRHDLGHAQRQPTGSPRQQEFDDRWMPKARELFGDLDRAALIAAIQREERGDTHAAPLAGRLFDNLCCDVEGTLIRSDGSINAMLLTVLREEAQRRPVVLCTGGDRTAIDPILRRAGIELPLLPWSALRGATVEIVFNDESPEAFVAKHGIHYTEYRQIT